MGASRSHVSIRTSGIATLVFILLATSVAPAEASGPTMLKRTVRITTRRFTSYWRDLKADSPEWNTWSWSPRIEFEIVGPVEGGSQLSVDYTMPDGKPWFTDYLETDEVGEGVWDLVTSDFSASSDVEKKATLSTGTFGFTIRLTNELTGRNESLMSGRFTVNKVHVGIPSRPKEFEYFVEQDWRLPLGAIWLNTADDAGSPPLYMGMWVRSNAWRSGQLAAYLMYNGKQIASTKEDTWSHIGLTAELLTVTNRQEDPAWHHIGVDFQGVRGMRGDNEGRTDLFFLEENPGEYELKILAKGKLVRSMKFTVGTDGKIVDSGIGTEQRPSGTRYLVPVKISGDLDGKWDQNAWKQGAYYGNPYAGFVALPVGAN